MKSPSIHSLVLSVSCDNKGQKIISFHLEMSLSKSMPWSNDSYSYVKVYGKYFAINRESQSHKNVDDKPIWCVGDPDDSAPLTQGYHGQ